MEEIGRIDAQGGAVEAIERGYFHRTLDESSYRWQQQVEAKEKLIVGVNTFIAKEEEKRASFQPDPTAEQRQKAQLEKVKRERDPQVVRDCLAAVRQALLDGGNTIPALVPAIKAYVTIGEICDVMREVYGEYSQPT